MTRYYFHVQGDSTLDEEGYDLADIATAKCEAVKLAGQLICDGAGKFWNTKELDLTVTDEQGLTLFSLHFFGAEAPAAHKG